MRVLMVAGEASGDLHAARVAHRLIQEGVEIEAVGGARLAAAGARLVARNDALAVLGFVDVARRLPAILGLKRQLERRLRQGRYDLLLTVDYPGFNLRLAASAHRLGVPTLHYVGPQIWAWRAGRLRRLRASVDHVALILPFEKPYYDAAGVPATFVGHPLLDDETCANPPAADAQATFDVGLLPGSRRQEIERHLPVMLEALAVLEGRGRRLRAAIGAHAGGAERLERWVRHTAGDSPPIVSTEPTPALLRSCRCALVASGTATLEAALSGQPFAVLYRTGRLNYAIARRLVRVPHIALANLVAGRPVVREFIQDACRAEILADEVERLLDDLEARRDIRTGLAQVRERLGAPGAAQRVASIALHLARSPKRNGR